MEKLSIRTGAKVDFPDITAQVQDIVIRSGVTRGICHLFVPHTTAGITINEHADPDVIEDIAAGLDNIVPSGRNYRHLEGNSPAHIKSSLMGHNVSVFIEDGRMVLGTWQGIFFCEFDGPRSRTLLVRIIADLP
ncbi:MAG: secondary thiamine-phosphate synthase enzyme YjbQ [Chloroflexota bacterium]